MDREIFVIQQLRAIAALLVVFHHASGQLDWVKNIYDFRFGNNGVDLFFVISGFIMVYTTNGRNTSPGAFMLRRIIRIVPLYWLYTVALTCIALIIPQVMRSTEAQFGHVLQSLLFIPHISPSFPDRFWPILIPGWTLNYEMAFYLVFAVGLWLPEKSRMYFLGAVMGLVYILGTKGGSLATLEFYSNDIIFEFLLGAILGSLYVRGRISGSGGWIIIVASVVISVLLGSMDGITRLFHAGIPAVGVLYGALLLGNSNFSTNGLLHKLGDASYSLYLSHVFTIAVCRVLWQQIVGVNAPTYSFLAASIFIILALILSSVVGVLSFELVEKRILSYLKKLSFSNISIPVQQNHSADVSKTRAADD